MLLGCNFTENFTVDVPWEFSETSNTISTAVSLGEFINQLLLKVISLQEKMQSEKMNNKHSQVLLVFRKNPRK